MWLNMIFLTIASLCVGFILGWIVARPRRWDDYICAEPTHDQPDTPMEKLAGGV